MEVSRKLEEAYKDKEEYWQQKNPNMQYSSWDLNTKFYYALTNQRRARNRIVVLHDDCGQWITEHKRVEKYQWDILRIYLVPRDLQSLKDFTRGPTKDYSSDESKVE